MLKSTLTLLILLVLPLQITLAQDYKFGKVSKEELKEKLYPLDSSANAAILYKKRRTYYDYDGNEGWILITKVHERLKIYNKEGNEWATKKISLYTDGTNETVSVKAYTYNLEGNKIEKIKLKNSEIYNENFNKYWNQKKFTMPNLTEGSIIEWEYVIRSPYIGRIPDMEFQYKIPVKFIDTEIKIPEYFVFKYLPNTYYPVLVNQSLKQRTLNFTYKEENMDRRSVMTGGGSQGMTSSHTTKVELLENIYSSMEKDIPAIRDEPFTNNIDNYKSKTSFEIIAYKPRFGVPEYFNTSWEDVTKTIYKNSNFGDQLDKTSHFKNDLASLINMDSPSTEKIDKIFQFVKSKIKWNNFNNKYTSDGVKKAYSDGVGNVAEINLTLVAMLREAGVKANPILVSTRDHGVPLFPTSNGFNYVIAGIEMDNNIILLDATEQYSSPNILPLRALNWQGRIVRENGSSSSINLYPQKHTTKKVFLSAKLDHDALASGSTRISYSNLFALNYRSNYNSFNEQDLISELEKDNHSIEILALKFSNKEDISKPLTQTLKFESDGQIELIAGNMYFSPLLHLAKSENPFKLDERKFPIDFGAPWEEKYTVSIEFPESFILESKPENVAYALPDNLGSYKFVIIEKGNTLQVLSNVKINAPIIASNNYGALKEFYKKMIDKQLEKVVLVKK